MWTVALTQNTLLLGATGDINELLTKLNRSIASLPSLFASQGFREPSCSNEDGLDPSRLLPRGIQTARDAAIESRKTIFAHPLTYSSSPSRYTTPLKLDAVCVSHVGNQRHVAIF